MHGASVTAAFLALALSAATAAEGVDVTDGAVRLRIQPAMIAMACTVTRSSGDAALDDAACYRALAARPMPEGLPAETIIETDADGRLVGCRTLPEIRPPPDFDRRCAAHLARMARARRMVPLGIDDWLLAGDFEDAPPTGQLRARLGVGEDGAPFSCLTLQSSGRPRFDESICRTLLRRVRFRPALDEEGRPMPSTFIYPVGWQQ